MDVLKSASMSPPILIFFFKTVLAIWSQLHFFLATPWGLWDLSSLTRDLTWIPSNEIAKLNHWISKEVPWSSLHFSFAFLATLHAMRDPSSLLRGRTCAPCSGRAVLTTGSPESLIFLSEF